jgi:hypothetical protein
MPGVLLPVENAMRKDWTAGWIRSTLGPEAFIRARVVTQALLPLNYAYHASAWGTGRSACATDIAVEVAHHVTERGNGRQILLAIQAGC